MQADLQSNEYGYDCVRCGHACAAPIQRRGRRKKYCNDCRGSGKRALTAKLNCKDCGSPLRAGLKVTCQSCRKLKEAERGRRKRQAATERNLASGSVADHKRCSQCGADKSISEFHRNISNYAGVSSWCKKCVTEYRRSKSATPEGSLAVRLRRQMRTDRPSRRINWNIRRALKGQETSPMLEREFGYSLHELRTHIERQFTTGMSWEQFFTGNIHLDHIVPVSSFDLSLAQDVMACYAITNLRPTWATDNLSKGAKRMHLI